MDLVAGRVYTERQRPIRHIDGMLLVITVLLVMTGLILLYSATASTLRGMHVDEFARVKKQAATAILGAILLLLIFTFDYRFFKVYAGFIYAGMLILLVLVRIPGIGSTSAGAQRWFDVAGFQISPSEIAKIALMFMLAAMLSELPSLPDLRDVLRVCLAGAVPTALVFIQPDIGTTIVLVTVIVGMLVVAGTRPRHLALLAATSIVLIVLAFQLNVVKSYQLDRLKAFLDPAFGSQTTNYNRQQALIAVSSGGVLGRGYMHGTQTQLDFVPEQHTDFIFTVAGEEFGFLGTVVVLTLYALLIWRAIRTASMSKDPFGTYVAAGIAAMFAIQMFVNIGMVIGIMPITGIPLPFMSYGGSSMLSSFAAIGILENIHMRRFK
ncbi:MAG: rod shape-determining protein RodA [Actinomycetota bacterium]|nr:rod shape-determining protein RodA [Actinomycetota bacterium]